MFSRTLISTVVVFALVATILISTPTGSTEVVRADAQWSTMFTAAVEPGASYQVQSSHGDLWPSAWSNDGKVYTINGDGRGFGTTARDIVVNVRDGDSPYLKNIVGRALTSNSSQVWSGAGFNRKPMGIISLDGVLYAAVQDLNTDFTSAPA